MVIFYYLCSRNLFFDMYDIYLKYHHIPCGAIIDRIRAKEKLSQRELALRSGIPYQRINDFIANRRRISPDNSLKLEKALGLEHQCFFYLIQTNHDIFKATIRLTEQKHPDKSKYRKALFWDTNFDTLDWQHNADWIIRRVFSYGNENEILETIRFYGKKKTKDTLLATEDTWNPKEIKSRMKKYLDYEIED